ncbi:uncharacterized protein LOC113027130 [Astatotilapia calliptera]|uniref:uncharacterized protein LOC113027130 n=1 Tax=Astatotilapia calliptera TaxID=8154 RepID=UPI000E4144DF|nr:uncharacterized protein LOC113027130 [Astatotilapia calliptera]
MSIQPIKNCSTTSNPKQRDKPHNFVISPQKLASSETVTHSRAPPEAEFQPSAHSGPLEAKNRAEDCTQLSLPEQGQCSVQLQSAMCVPGGPVPAGSVTVSTVGSGEPGQPVLVSVSAGGPEEPVQQPASSPASPTSPAAAAAAAPASSSPGPASALPGAAGATQPLCPKLPPRHRQSSARLLVGRHRHYGRPPERRCYLPRGRPPDLPLPSARVAPEDELF